jgi:hypothetical protein
VLWFGFVSVFRLIIYGTVILTLYSIINCIRLNYVCVNILEVYYRQINKKAKMYVISWFVVFRCGISHESFRVSRVCKKTILWHFMLCCILHLYQIIHWENINVLLFTHELHPHYHKKNIRLWKTTFLIIHVCPIF